MKQDLNFDPAQRYFDIQMLDLGESDSRWKTVTAEEWQKREQGDRRPLAEQSKEIAAKKREG